MIEKSYREGNNLFEKGYLYLKQYGISKTFSKIKNKFFKQKQQVVEYGEFLRTHTPDESELVAQRREVFSKRPLISIVIPMYQTNETYLCELLDTVVNQTYDNWQLCLADASTSDALKEVIEKHCGNLLGTKIKYRHLEKNLGISGNTNAAIDMADGDYIAFSDHDDTLSISALYEVVKAINGGDYDCIYSDEDKLDTDTGKYFEPNFKPDFDIDLLRANNYITHLFVCKSSIVRELGGLKSDYDGAQDHDFILRCVEKSEKIYHIPKVLYHWRFHMLSTAANPESKLYAYEAGVRAISDHYKRCGIDASVEKGPFLGAYRTRYNVQDRPLISVIIPNMEHKADLEKCINSLLKDAYKNIEIIVVENNSKSNDIFEFYDYLTGEFAEKNNIKVKVVKYEDVGFNFSALMNLGVKNASGKLYLLLNNDIELIDDNFVYELASPILARNDVAITGAKLLYPDDTVQHSGVIIGIGGVAGHAFTGLDKDDPGYMFRNIVTSDLSAVTAAALMVKKEAFDAVGGFYEGLPVAFNDVDFCLRVLLAGCGLILYNPYAIAHHFESKSRGLEETQEQKDRFNNEVRIISTRMDEWCQALDKNHIPGVYYDRYYNPNLSLLDGNFSLSK